MTLTRKVVAAGLIFLLLNIATTAFAIANIVIIRTAVVQLSDNTVKQVQLSGNFNTDMFRGMAEALFYARDHQATNRESALQELHDAGAILSDLGDLEQRSDSYQAGLSAEQALLQSRRVALYAIVGPKILEILQAADARDDTALARQLDELNAYKLNIEQFEEDSSELAERSIAAATAAVSQRFQNALTSAGVAFGLFMLVLLAILLVLRRWIVQPITRLSLAARAVADGHFDRAVDVTSGDEIGHLQQTFNVMTRNLESQRAALEQRGAELARASDEAQAARAAAEQASNLKSQFLANMSHELRTPLNSIINFTRILSSGMRGPVNAEQHDYLNRVRQSGEHLLGLINDILDLSKIESGRMELYTESIQIAEVVHSVLSTAAGLVKGKPIELREELGADLPLLQADRTRLRQILLNLLSNAAKFTDHGAITVRAVQAGDRIMLSVADTGIGIAPEHLTTIFEEFRQIEGQINRRYEGTGLGLAICRKFIELHGGQIEVQSALGVGSTFTFSLPIAVSQPAAPAAVLPADQRTGIPVLVIDDDPAAIEIVAAYLGRDGYAVHGVTDSRRALEEARSLRPAAIILDVLMPYKDGWEVLADLKADPELRAVPVVLYTIVEEQKLGFYLGASAYLTKPVDGEQLRTTVAQLIALDATILVIDDDPNAREIVSRQLEQAGSYRVCAASNGKDGLAQVLAQPPDLIILDLMMPEVDGFAVLQELSLRPDTQAIPVIVLTAKDLTANEREMLHRRVSGLLTKGVSSADQLLGKVSSLLGVVAENRR